MEQGGVVFETNIAGLELSSRGKVRDIWLLLDGKLLIVATDRISAFDVVAGAIPGKGKILTKMSEFWFKSLKSIGRNHFIGTNINNLGGLSQADIYTNDLIGRCMIVEKANWVVPIECVVRGYLAGSGWNEYQKTGLVCGNKLPADLKEGDKLPEPIFTPATKAEAGQHDENITYKQMVTILDDWLSKNCNIYDHDVSFLALGLRRRSLDVYEEARDFAAKHEIIIADTKFEFGIINGGLALIDEVLTPDSSRFWPAEKWKPGQSQQSFDKQFLRDHLNSIGWNKKPPAPELPEEVIQITAGKYRDAMQRLLF